MPGPGCVGDHPRDLQVHIGLGADRIADIGPIEARDDHPLDRNAQLLGDVGAGMRIGGRGQRQPGHLRKGIHQRFEQPVIGAEVMPPFADAVRLVDREQAERRGGQQLAEMPRRSALGRDIQKVELAVAEARDRLGAVLVDAGQRGGADADCFGGAQLVVHQRDQRADHDATSVHHHRGQLVTQRLARAGRHDRQSPLFAEHAVDHLFLDTPELAVPEDFMELGKGVGDHRRPCSDGMGAGEGHIPQAVSLLMRLLCYQRWKEREWNGKPYRDPDRQ